MAGASYAALMAIDVIAIMTQQEKKMITAMMIFDRWVYFPPSGCGLRLPQLLQQHLQYLRAHTNENQTMNEVIPTAAQTTGITTKPCTAEHRALSADGSTQDVAEPLLMRMVCMPFPVTGLALKS